MIDKIKSQNKGLLLLRFGLVAVYLYFAFSQFTDPERWSGIVPDWATSLTTLESVTIVYANAVFELVFSVLLILGLWTKWVSFLLGAHLAVITISMGFTPTGMRDFGLTMATFAHGLLEGEKQEV